jgi:hypothetical protein
MARVRSHSKVLVPGTYANHHRLGDVINSWRVSDLHLEPLAAAVGPDIIDLMKVPYTYCWSPALVPKPSDWGDSIGKTLSTDPVLSSVLI